MKFKVNPEKVAVLVIDMTNAFVEPGAPLEVPKAREIIPALKRVLASCRGLGIPILYVIHAFREDGLDAGLMFDFYPVLKSGCLNYGSSGTQVYAEISPEANDITVYKNRYSAFFNTDLDLILRRLGKDTIIVTGEASEFCCESTVRDAFYRDYKVLFLSDANASSSEQLHAATMKTISNGFGEVLSSEDLLGRLAVASQQKIQD